MARRYTDDELTEILNSSTDGLHEWAESGSDSSDSDSEEEHRPPPFIIPILKGQASVNDSVTPVTQGQGVVISDHFIDIYTVKIQKIINDACYR